MNSGISKEMIVKGCEVMKGERYNGGVLMGLRLSWDFKYSIPIFSYLISNTGEVICQSFFNITLYVLMA